MTKQLIRAPQVVLGLVDVASLDEPLGGQPHRTREGAALFVFAHRAKLKGGEGFVQRFNHDHGFAPQRAEGDLVGCEVFPLPGALHLEQPQPMCLVAVPDEQVGAALAHVAEIEDPVTVRAKPVANRSVVQVSSTVSHALIVATLMLCLSNLAAGCSDPRPAGVPLANADRAARVVMDLWREDGPTPAIFGVPFDASCLKTLPDGSRSIGFVNPDGGKCVGGVTIPGEAIYLLVHPDVRYSHALPHELAHWRWGDDGHRRRGLWEDQDTNLVPAAQTLLRMFPEVDTMSVAQ